MAFGGIGTKIDTSCVINQKERYSFMGKSKINVALFKSLNFMS